MAEEIEEIDRIQVRIPKGRRRRFLALLPERTRSKFVIDAIDMAIMKNDINYLKKYQADLKIELKKVDDLLNFEQIEDQKLKEKLLSLIENQAAQEYFLQYHNRLNPERPYKGEQKGEEIANQWLETRIYDFQVETGYRLNPTEFKDLYEQWKKLKVTE